MMRWLMLFLLLLPLSYALEQPCFQEVTVKGNGSEKIFLLNWTSSPELDVEYSLYFNMNATPTYVGNQSFTYVSIFEGNNHFGIVAKTFNGTQICEGDIVYAKNKPPTAPGVDCPVEVELSAGVLHCNISYDSVDPNNDSLLYSFFLDDQLKVADFSLQVLPVAGVSDGMHNISICAFDGEFFACSYDPVNFIFIPKPTFKEAIIHNPAIPFYGDLVQAFVNISVWVNDTRECVVSGRISQDSESYDVWCSEYAFNMFNCYANLSYLMSPGKYDLYLVAGNGAKNETYSRSASVDVYSVLSVVVVSPTYDLTQVFDDWVITQEPAKFYNTGMMRMRRILMWSEPIVCIGATFNNITVGPDSDLSGSYDASGGLFFDVNLRPDKKEEFYSFIYNPGRANPKDCHSVWKTEVYGSN